MAHWDRYKNNISDRAIQKLGRLDEVINRNIERKLLTKGGLPTTGNRLVRFAKTLSHDFPYPEGESYKYEIILGKPMWNNEDFSEEEIEFEAFGPDGSSEFVRIMHCVDKVQLDEGKLVQVALHDRKWHLISGETVSGGGVSGTGTQIIGFDTGGYCSDTPDPQFIWVRMYRVSNNNAPSEPPSEALGFPENATLVYQGFSHDNYSTPTGSAYNAHVYLYMVCDASFDAEQFHDEGSYSNVIPDWIDELNSTIPPNEQWIATFGFVPLSVGNSRDYMLDLIESLLEQPSTYISTDGTPLSLYLDCEVKLCDSLSPSLYVVGREIRVKITERTCGLNKVAEEDDEGYVTVKDTLGSFLYGRRPEELTCRRGVAAYVKTDGDYDCHWMIIWMDMFDEIQVVSDAIIGTRGIEIERKRVDVWRECDLPDEYIEGNTCEAS